MGKHMAVSMSAAPNDLVIATLVNNPVTRVIREFLVEGPFMYLYLHGPSLLGYGFWEGKDAATICSEMTGAPSDHWAANADACDGLITRKFQAGLVFVYFLLYIISIYSIVCIIFAVVSRRRTPPAYYEGGHGNVTACYLASDRPNGHDPACRRRLVFPDAD